MYDGKRVKKDKIHYSIRKMDSYNKKYNFCVSPRILGKSTVMWNKIYRLWKKYHLPALIIRRYEADITDEYIEAAEDSINYFLPEHKRVEFKFNKGSKGGSSQVYIGDKLFMRILALNSKESRLKSAACATSLLFFDEFICNNLNESYVKDECNKLQSIYGTYSRKYIEYMKTNYGEKNNYVWKLYFMGNPYSLFNPYWSNLIKLDLEDIYPGCFIVGSNYIIDCPPLSKELLQWAIDNQIYDAETLDSEYNRYSIFGQAINDENIVVYNKQPSGYTLKYIFRIMRRYIGVFVNGNDERWDQIGKYWCKELNKEEVSAKRKIYAVDFDNLVANSSLITSETTLLFYKLSKAMTKRQVSYKSISIGYIMQELYKTIK